VLVCTDFTLRNIVTLSVILFWCKRAVTEHTCCYKESVAHLSIKITHKTGVLLPSNKDDSNDIDACLQINIKLLRNLKYEQFAYIWYIYSNILIANTVFELDVCTSWTAILVKCNAL
jgi:hypothetical protein